VHFAVDFLVINNLFPGLSKEISPLLEVEHVINITASLSGGLAHVGHVGAKKVIHTFPVHIICETHKDMKNIEPPKLQHPKLELIRNSSFVLDGVTLEENDREREREYLEVNTIEMDSAFFAKYPDPQPIVDVAISTRKKKVPEQAPHRSRRHSHAVSPAPKSLEHAPSSVKQHKNDLSVPDVPLEYKNPLKKSRSLGTNPSKQKELMESSTQDQTQFVQIPRTGSFVFLEDFENVDIEELTPKKSHKK